MPLLSGGVELVQIVVTVAKNDATINNEIATQSSNGYILNQIFIDGSNVILLFAKTTNPT